jgi:rubrerythrin
MTVHGDLDRAIAMAEASKGNYLLFAVDSEDETARQVFQDMADDMERHVGILRSRQEYLEQYNPLNGENGDEESGKKEKKEAKGKKEGS